MNYEEFKKYVDKMNESIFNKLQDNEDELVFYVQLIKQFNKLCKEKIEVEQKCKKQKEVIDKAVEFINSIDLYSHEYALDSIEINDLLDILKEAYNATNKDL